MTYLEPAERLVNLLAKDLRHEQRILILSPGGGKGDPMVHSLEAAVEDPEDGDIGAQLLKPFYCGYGKGCGVLGLKYVGPVSEDEDFALLEEEVRW